MNSIIKFSPRAGIQLCIQNVTLFAFKTFFITLMLKAVKMMHSIPFRSLPIGTRIYVLGYSLLVQCMRRQNILPHLLSSNVICLWWTSDLKARHFFALLHPSSVLYVHTRSVSCYKPVLGQHSSFKPVVRTYNCDIRF